MEANGRTLLLGKNIVATIDDGILRSLERAVEIFNTGVRFLETYKALNILYMRRACVLKGASDAGRSSHAGSFVRNFMLPGSF